MQKSSRAAKGPATFDFLLIFMAIFPPEKNFTRGLRGIATMPSCREIFFQ